MDEFGAVSGLGSSHGDRSRDTSQPPSQSCAAAPNKQLLSLLKAETCQEMQVLNNVQNPCAGNILLWHCLAQDAFQACCIPCLPEEHRATGSDPSRTPDTGCVHGTSPPRRICRGSLDAGGFAWPCSHIPEQEQSGCDGTNTGAPKLSSVAPKLPSMAEPPPLQHHKTTMGLINLEQQPGEPDGTSTLP